MFIDIDTSRPPSARKIAAETAEPPFGWKALGIRQFG